MHRINKHSNNVITELINPKINAVQYSNPLQIQTNKANNKIIGKNKILSIILNINSRILIYNHSLTNLCSDDSRSFLYMQRYKKIRGRFYHYLIIILFKF